MTDDRAARALYPAHDWGRMASDPFLPVGREDVEAREMLKRMWMRSGGLLADFDNLFPLDGPYGQEPPESLSREPD